MYLHYRKPPRRPKKVDDLLSATLTSGEAVDPNELGIGGVTESSFIVTLATALDVSVNSGLDTAQRIGWDGESLWQVGELHRVYYLSGTERASGQQDPDRFHTGIAPAVKLLHAVVSRLADVDLIRATQFVGRWKLTDSLVHVRLWAAMARDPRITPANEVGVFLLSLDSRHFWDINSFPEFAELRAKRFGELAPREQTALTTRIRKGPPRALWPRKADADQVANLRVHAVVRELRRIEIAGASLPKRDKDWLDATISKYPDLLAMNRIDEGFSRGPQIHYGPSSIPDSRYELLEGEDRLKALEAALSSVRRGWDDDSSGPAAGWIRQPENSFKVLADLESSPDGGAAFPEVWDLFGWAHSSTLKPDEQAERQLAVQASRVLSLMIKLPKATIYKAIDGVAQWLSNWKQQVVALPDGLGVWLKTWPIAVEFTNSKRSEKEEARFDTIAGSSDDREARAPDTSNSAVGKLIEVFLATCPTIRPGETPFHENNAQRRMRDAIERSFGSPAGLIVRHRLIEGLHYFLKADAEWTRSSLVAPLLEDNDEARDLWRAVASRIRYYDELQVIGDRMVERATDPKLTRETRQSLVFSLIVECLYAFLDDREPAVSKAQVQQMIRALDDEVRAYGAGAIRRFVASSAVLRERQPLSPEDVFRTAARPFQNRSGLRSGRS